MDKANKSLEELLKPDQFIEQEVNTSALQASIIAASQELPQLHQIVSEPNKRGFGDKIKALLFGQPATAMTAVVALMIGVFAINNFSQKPIDQEDQTLVINDAAQVETLEIEDVLSIEALMLLQDEQLFAAL